MPFMIPVYTDEDFHVGWSRDEVIAIPAYVYGSLELFAQETGATECEVSTGEFWGRLSAPGYMDATEWDGPHASLALAKASLAEMWDVDPDSGDDRSE